MNSPRSGSHTSVPLVSVGLPTRNRAHLLPASLGSLLGQTYKNIEFIISDNASTDGTEELLRSYAEKDARIRYIRQKEDINGMENHEFVLKEARGDYFMWASDDDWWDATFVAKLVAVLEQHKEYGVAMSHYRKKYVNCDTPRTEIVTHQFTNLSHQELFWKYLRGHITPIFFFGLYRTAILRSIFKRKTPSCYNGLLLTLSEVALATRSYSVEEVLHEQLQDCRSYTVRHPTNPYTAGVLHPLAVTRYISKVPGWLLTSSAIPVWRKRFIFLPWLRRLWMYKRKVVKELIRYCTYAMVPFRLESKETERLLDVWLSSDNYVVLAGVLFQLERAHTEDRTAIMQAVLKRKSSYERESDPCKKLEFIEFRLRHATHS